MKHDNYAERVIILALIVTMAAAGLSFVIIGGANAQETGENSTGNQSTAGEYVTQDLRLVKSEYNRNGGNGTATLVFEADSVTTITLTDVGKFEYGGEMNRRTIVLEPGRSEVEFSVTESKSGMVGVTIDTGEVLYAEPITKVGSGESEDGSLKPPERNDALALVVGVALVPLAAIGYKRHRDVEKDEEVRYVNR